MTTKTRESRLSRFVTWYFSHGTERAQAHAYLSFMAVAYVAVFLATLYAFEVGLLLCWATAILDVYKHMMRKVRTRLPLSLPLGLVGIAGVAVKSLFLG